MLDRLLRWLGFRSQPETQDTLEWVHKMMAHPAGFYGKAGSLQDAVSPDQGQSKETDGAAQTKGEET